MRREPRGRRRLPQPAVELINLTTEHGSAACPDGHGEGVQGIAGAVGPGFGEGNFLADHKVGAVGGRAAKYKGEVQTGCAFCLQCRNLTLLIGAAAVGAIALFQAGDAYMRLGHHIPLAENMIEFGLISPFGITTTRTLFVL